MDEEKRALYDKYGKEGIEEGGGGGGSAEDDLAIKGQATFQAPVGAIDNRSAPGIFIKDRAELPFRMVRR